MVLVIIINKNLRRKTRSENPAQCYESSSDGFIVLAQSVLYHSFLYGAGTGLLDCMFVNQTPYIRPLETPRGCPAALRYHPRTPPDTPPKVKSSQVNLIFRVAYVTNVTARTTCEKNITAMHKKDSKIQ